MTDPSLDDMIKLARQQAAKASEALLEAQIHLARLLVQKDIQAIFGKPQGL